MNDGTNEGHSHSRMTTVKAILGPGAIVLRMSDFCGTYFPSTWVHLDLSHLLHRQLSAFVIAPESSLQAAEKVDTACRQSLTSLVDDAVWFLLQRRERLRGSSAIQDGRNLMCQGYSIPNFYNSEQQSYSSIHAAAVMTDINNNVLFWKTNPACRLLHEMVGDEIMRIILIRTSVFVPLVKDDDPDHSSGNYMQLSGPSCRPGIMEQQQQQPSSTRKRRKRQRPMPTCSHQPNTLRPQAHVPTKGLYYSSTYIPHVGLPTSHILNGPCKPEDLLNSMLGSHYPNTKLGRRQRKRWRSLSVKGIPFFESIIRKHRSCDYHRLLNRFCPLPAIVAQREIDIAQAAAAHSPVHGVIDFVSAVVRHVIPSELLGSSQNLQQLVCHVISFIRLRRQEFLANKSIMNGMKITHASWLFATEQGKVHRSDHGTAQQRFLRILRWIFGQFLIPLLTSTFYVTETEMSGRRVLYYRKPVWSIFRSLSMKKLLKQQYTEITQEEAKRRLAVQQMGFSRLRLLPKETGVRPIATLCKQEAFRRFDQTAMVDIFDETDNDEEIDTPFFKARKKQRSMPAVVPRAPSTSRSTNQVLSNVFSILRNEYSQKKELFGAGVDGLHFFYPRYRAFVEGLRPAVSDATPVYFVSVDIQHAYDGIDQSYLLAIVDKILSQREYCIQRYDVLHPFVSLNRVIKRPQRIVGPSASVEPIHAACVDADGFCQSVFVDSVNACVATKDQLARQLTEHLGSHLVAVQGRYGDRYLVQTTGIPQGSILSTMLCNFYYGAFEKKSLSEFLGSNASSSEDSESMLIRMVDDFLLATTNRSLAEAFLKTMEEGDESLGVTINKAKTNTSRSLKVGENADLQPEDESERRFFPWCGMLFDIKTFGVRIDYGRLIRGDIGDGLTVERGSQEGRRFSSALRMFIRPRCIPILFDSAINDTRVQAINFYQLFIFCAAKAATYLKASDIMPKLETNLEFIVDAMTSSVKYGHNLIHDRLSQARPGLELDFSRQTGLWIGYTAFYDVLIRRSGFAAVAASVREIAASSTVSMFFIHAVFEAKRGPGIKELLAHDM